MLRCLVVESGWRETLGLRLALVATYRQGIVLRGLLLPIKFKSPADEYQLAQNVYTRYLTNCLQPSNI